jgi:hypothetical protein
MSYENSPLPETGSSRKPVPHRDTFHPLLRREKSHIDTNL